MQAQAVSSTPLASVIPKTALILDDCDFDRAKIRRLNARLDHPMELVEVATIEAMIACLEDQYFDLIMIDYSLGSENGLTALDLLKKHTQHDSAAKIMVSGTTDTKIAVSAMKLGCKDVVAKQGLTQQAFQTAVNDALTRAMVDGERPNTVLKNNMGNTAQLALSAAMDDPEIRTAIIASLKGGSSQKANKDSTEEDVDALLNGFFGEDDFIFRI